MTVAFAKTGGNIAMIFEHLDLIFEKLSHSYVTFSSICQTYSLKVTFWWLWHCSKMGFPTHPPLPVVQARGGCVPGEGVVAKTKHSCREQRRRNSTTSISRTCLLLLTAARAGGKCLQKLSRTSSPLWAFCQGFQKRVISFALYPEGNLHTNTCMTEQNVVCMQAGLHIYPLLYFITTLWF